MSGLSFSNSLVQEFMEAAREIPPISELVDQIIQMTESFYILEDEKATVSERISAWDRLKFLGKTKDQREEQDLKRRIRDLKWELTTAEKRLDEELEYLFEDLSRTQDNFRQLQLWNQIPVIEEKIKAIRCRSSGIWARVEGIEAALYEVNRLQGFLQVPAAGVVSVVSLIAQVKRKLLGYK